MAASSTIEDLVSSSNLEKVNEGKGKGEGVEMEMEKGKGKGKGKRERVEIQQNLRAPPIQKWTKQTYNKSDDDSSMFTTDEVVSIFKCGTTFICLRAEQIDEYSKSFFGSRYKTGHTKNLTLIKYIHGQGIHVSDKPRFLTEASNNTIRRLPTSTFNVLFDSENIILDNDNMMRPTSLMTELDDVGFPRVVFTYNDEVYFIEEDRILHMRGLIHEEIAVRSSYFKFFSACVECNVNMNMLDVSNIINMFSL